MEVTHPEPALWELSLSTPFYEIRRTVRKEGDRVRVRDRFQGKGVKDAVAVTPRHEISISAGCFPTAWIGGDPDPLKNDVRSPSNPTLFIPMSGTGLGLVVEDDVLRLQGLFSYEAALGKAVIRSDEMVLSEKGGGAWETEISLYPTGHDRYWEFINRVRRDRDLRTTLPGTIWFTYPENIVLSDPKAVRKILEENRVARVIFWEGPSPDHYTLTSPYVIQGAAQLLPEAGEKRAAYEENLRKAIQRVHQISPGTQVLLYVHSHVCSLLGDGGKKELDGAWITDAAGSPVRRHAEDKRFYPLYYVYPTLENPYGRAMTRLIDHFLAMGADGIYWDEMSAADGPVRVTYSEFDGHTADVDPASGKVIRLKGLVSLLSGPFKQHEVKRLVRAGKVGARERSAGNTGPGIPAHDPDGGDDGWSCETSELHLTTPYAYTWAPHTIGQFRDRLGKGGLSFRPDSSAPFVGALLPHHARVPQWRMHRRPGARDLFRARRIRLGRGLVRESLPL